MMLNAQLAVGDVLLIQNWLAAICPSTTDWALEVCPHFESDRSIRRANSSINHELRSRGKDRRNGGEGVARRRLSAE